MLRVLVVEDNADLAYGLRNNLEIEGYVVDVARDGEAGLRLARRAGFDAPDLIILDVMLPKLDGFRVLRTLRNENNSVPTLLLTARGEESDVVRGLRLGADDYVTKPFGILELLARVEALLRRAETAAEPARIQGYGEVRIDLAARTVERDGRKISLTPKEFDLLVALLRRKGAAASRAELIREVWATRRRSSHVPSIRISPSSEPSSRPTPRHHGTSSPSRGSAIGWHPSSSSKAGVCSAAHAGVRKAFWRAP